MNIRRAHMTFFGADASEAQGLFNASSETTSLPADSGSNSTLTTYIPGELMEFLVAQIRAISDLSYNMLKPIKIVAPWNAINYLKGKVVPLTSYQEKGAGTSSIAKVFENIVYDMNGMQVEFVPLKIEILLLISMALVKMILLILFMMKLWNMRSI